jgi:hypothetical protein
MKGFSAEWLALREPYDLAARNALVRDAVANAFLGQAAISVVDLACGAGYCFLLFRFPPPPHAAGAWTPSAAAPELAVGRQ